MRVFFHVMAGVFVGVAAISSCQAVVATQTTLGTISGLCIGAIFAVFARMAQASAHRAADDEAKKAKPE